MDLDEFKEKPQMRKPEIFSAAKDNTEQEKNIYEKDLEKKEERYKTFARKQPVLHEETLSSELQFIGRVFTVETSRVELADGRKSRREIVHHPGGACVIALDDDDNFFLVKQYRVGPQAPLREIPAGKLEADESPLECARRELAEEAGCFADSWQLLSQFYPSPGYTDEVISIYLATDLSCGEQDLDQGEFLHLEKISLDDAIQEVIQGQISDGKTIIAILMVATMRAKGEL